MISAFFISQILIGVAFIFDLASFQFKARKVTLSLFALSASLISAHYFFLSEFAAGVIVALSAARFIVSIFSTDARLKYLFLLLITALGIWAYTGVADLLVIAVGYFATFAAFQPNEKRLRELMMLGTSCAIVFNIIVFSPAAILLESFFLGSNLLSYWRFFFKR